MKAWLHWLALSLAVVGTLSACGGQDTTQNLEMNNQANIAGRDGPRALGPMTLAQAIDRGAVTVVVTGDNLEAVRFTVTAIEPVQVTLGSGMLVTSSDPGTQNMVTAETVEVTLEGSPEAPVTKEIVVPAYCINRYRDTPTATSSFSLTEGSAEQRPLQALAQCLAGPEVEHEARQDAIWVISDRWAYMTADEYVADRLERLQSQILAAGPDLAAERTAQATDYFRRDFARLRETTGPLLARCGYNLSDLPMFA